MTILLTVLVSRMATAWAARTVTRSCSGPVVSGLAALSAGQDCFNIYEGLEMHGERG